MIAEELILELQQYNHAAEVFMYHDGERFQIAAVDKGFGGLKVDIIAFDEFTAEKAQDEPDESGGDIT
jgi:hypothetical protein